LYVEITKSIAFRIKQRSFPPNFDEMSEHRFSCLCANIRSPHDITVAWHRRRANRKPLPEIRVNYAFIMPTLSVKGQVRCARWRAWKGARESRGNRGERCLPHLSRMAF